MSGVGEPVSWSGGGGAGLGSPRGICGIEGVVCAQIAKAHANICEGSGWQCCHVTSSVFHCSLCHVSHVIRGNQLKIING